jgi:hypothetical protein
MRLKTIVGIGFALVSIASLVSTDMLKLKESKAEQQTQTFVNSINTSIKQLPSENGMIPVEIRQVRAYKTSPNQINEFSCTIKNNTSKAIISYSLSITTITEAEGKETRGTEIQFIDSFLHPDVREIRKLQPIAAGKETYTESPGPVQFEPNVSVKQIQVSIDYIEFEDKTTLGPDARNSSKRIALKREGAAKYKEWLVQMYVQKGRSINAILPLLQTTPLPQELALDGPIMKQGAIIYRKSLLNLYDSIGAQAVEQYLNR